MITTIADYLKYYASLRRRTLRFAEAVPPDRIDWSPAPGEYTCGDILRHIGAVQLMNWRVVAGEAWDYPGHGPELGADHVGVVACLEDYGERSIAVLKSLPDTVLRENRPDLNGNPTTAWRFLTATIEHEVHHRSQLATYLHQMGVEPPQLFGVFMESLPEKK